MITRSILDKGELGDPASIFIITNVTVSGEDLDWWLRNRWENDAKGNRRLEPRANERIATTMPTGAPGRPSKGMHLIRAEFDRRITENTCKLLLREEATDLKQWFYRENPNAQSPAALDEIIDQRLHGRCVFCGAHYTRANPEQCLLATRGNPKRLSQSVCGLIIAPRREHSRKPDEFYCRAAALMPGPYLDLFSRDARRGGLPGAPRRVSSTRCGHERAPCPYADRRAGRFSQPR